MSLLLSHGGYDILISALVSTSVPTVILSNISIPREDHPNTLTQDPHPPLQRLPDMVLICASFLSITQLLTHRILGVLLLPTSSGLPTQLPIDTILSLLVQC